MIDLSTWFPVSASDPPAYDAVTNANVDHWADEGRALLEQALAALRRGLPPTPGGRMRRVALWLATETGRTLRGITGLLVGGGMSLSAWFRGVLAHLAPGHFAAALAALGTLSPDPADVGIVAGQVNRQAGFLARFRGQIASTAELLGPRTVARAEMYGHAVWGTAQNLSRMVSVVAGRVAEEKRILGLADHCKTCLREAALGWSPAGTLRPIGDSECTVWCKCHFAFR